MRPSPLPVRVLLLLALACAALRAQVSISGRVIDETGAPVAGARVEIRDGGGSFAATSSDVAGNFNLSLGPPGEYSIRAERLGFYLFEGKGQRFEAGLNRLTITLNHIQEFSERVDVVASPPAIDPQQASDHRELDSAEIQAVPFPAPQDYRNALPLMNGVLQDNAGRIHVNGAETNQTNYALDGFNIADPFTGRLEARVNIETIQTMDLETSRFAAENGRGSAGMLDVKTKMGDDRWRAGGTNFIPSASTDGGLHINKWTPRFELSGPIAKGRAWFHNGFDAFYSMDVIHGLPSGENQTRGLTANDLTRVQVNLTPSNILTGSFLVNLADNARYGLSIVNPAEATNSHRQALFMTTIRDQHYYQGALLDVGYADTRTSLRDTPQGDRLFEITPYGNRGNYFIDMDRHAYRQQWVANLFLPTVHFGGEHELKFGIDFERESFHQRALRRPYEVLRDDYSVARQVSFSGSPFESRGNFEGAQYIQDHWTPREGLAFDAGLRSEWNQFVREVEVAPRLAAVWAPRRLKDTKFSIGWGVYYDAISLATIARQEDPVSLSTFYLPGGGVRGPIETAFRVDERRMEAPYSRVASAGLERKLPFDFYARAEYVRRTGNRGFTFAATGDLSSPGGVYELRKTRRDRYDGFDISVRRTFAREFEWFAGYVASRSRTSAAVDYSVDSPIFGPQMSGPLPWDATHRFHMWGWLPLPNERLPGCLRFITRNTTAAYLVEYRTGFPFNVQDEEGFLVGAPGSRRLPGYFNINLHLERKFRALHYLWAWRFGFNNLTNNGNPNAVNNVIGTPQFLTYGRGQARAFSVRLRLLGRK
jgi:hypothetical protein